MNRRLYPSDLSAEEWVILEPLIRAAKPGGKPRTTARREVLNAMFDVNKRGGQGRMLPQEFPKWQPVYTDYTTWRKAGRWGDWNARLREKVRQAEGREATPSAATPIANPSRRLKKGATRLRRSEVSQGA
jgi:transposase